MSKSKFEKFILSNIKTIKNIYCRVWSGFDDDNNYASWLEVYIDNNKEYYTIFYSDYCEENSKDLINLQDKWSKKLKTWINPNWNINLIIDKQNI